MLFYDNNFLIVEFNPINTVDAAPILACPPKVVPSVKLVFVQTERNKEYDT